MRFSRQTQNTLLFKVLRWEYQIKSVITDPPFGWSLRQMRFDSAAAPF